MDPLTAAHILILGLWGGLILVEVIFEIQMLRGYLNDVDISIFHRITDRYFELPILAAVVITGWLLWHRSGYADELLLKVLFGLGAVAANVICYIIVELRATKAIAIRDEDNVLIKNAGRIELHKLSLALVSTIAPGLFLGLMALVIGGSRIGWW